MPAWLSAAWAWVPVFALPIAWVLAYDLWAEADKRWTLSKQAHDWAFNPTIGPIIGAVATGGLVWFLLHILRYRAH